MSLHECPRCGDQVATNTTTGGAFDLPPKLYCMHGETAVGMDVVDHGVKVDVDDSA